MRFMGASTEKIKNRGRTRGTIKENESSICPKSFPKRTTSVFLFAFLSVSKSRKLFAIINEQERSPGARLATIMLVLKVPA